MHLFIHYLSERQLVVVKERRVSAQFRCLIIIISLFIAGFWQQSQQTIGVVWEPEHSPQWQIEWQSLITVL